MDIAEAVAFTRNNHRAVLATPRSGELPQLSPVLVVADDEDRLLISTRETAVKARNAARDPQVSLCVLTDAFFGQWVRIDGEVELIHLPEAMDLLIDYYRRVSGEHPHWDDYRSAMTSEMRLIMRITPTAAGPDVSG